MKLYICYSQSHERLYREWFLPSLQDDFSIVSEEIPQECYSGVFMDDGWLITMRRKTELFLRAIDENWGGCFVFSDVDIQFFRPISDVLEIMLQGNDLVIQKEGVYGACTGFFICRANERMLSLFKGIREIMRSSFNKKSEQDLLNEYLLDRKKIVKKISSVSIGTLVRSIMSVSRLRWNYLPKTFMVGKPKEEIYWEPGVSLKVPAGIYLHHANWTFGVSNKIAQLQYVNNLVRKNPELI